ncbi:tetratricopeptide repeat protein [Oscillatoria sp. CS-180]|uniref:tetratricopeptide repeat protein n=1 Tax=Oscillatoria sp. CS-180 TaxID=3021720 RepID=UPI00232E7CC1|nr:tetratricopeptide repeat protein [Oscillatoria sp. CS-180]MDB9528321.1 tetratricopeptide repeat protein [Oscillatoria sp. CS-180]
MPHPPTPPSQSNENSVEFLGLNLDAFRELVTFARVAEGFTLAIAELNFEADGDLIIQALETHKMAQSIQFMEMDFSEAASFSLLNEVNARLADTPMQPERKRVLLIRGLSTAIGVKGNYSQFLADLNYSRDLLAAQVPHPIVLFLPDYGVTRLAHYAKDFWTWKSGLFRFRTTRQRIETSQTQMGQASRDLPTDSLPAKQARIEQLEQLLSESIQTGNPPTHPQPLCIALALELGDAYRSLSELDQARRHYHSAWEWAKTDADLEHQANALFGLGQVHRLRDNHSKASVRFDQALHLYQAAGDRLGEANTLIAKGDVLQFLDRRSEALQHYDQALELYQATGARLGEANTLKAKGDVLQFLDRRSEALQHYDQALELYQATGARLGEANVIQELGKMQDNLEESLRLLQQAQSLYEAIGDRYSQCRNLLKFVSPAHLRLGQQQDALKALQCAAELARDTEFEFFYEAALQEIRELESHKETASMLVSKFITWILLGVAIALLFGWLIR